MMRPLLAKVLCIAVCGDKLVYFSNAPGLVVKATYV